jgi:hypothetical protein
MYRSLPGLDPIIPSVSLGLLSADASIGQVKWETDYKAREPRMFVDRIVKRFFKLPGFAGSKLEEIFSLPPRLSPTGLCSVALQSRVSTRALADEGCPCSGVEGGELTDELLETTMLGPLVWPDGTEIDRRRRHRMALKLSVVVKFVRNNLSFLRSVTMDVSVALPEHILPSKRERSHIDLRNIDHNGLGSGPPMI